MHSLPLGFGLVGNYIRSLLSILNYTTQRQNTTQTPPLKQPRPRMHFITALTAALLPLAALANPIAASPLSHEEAEVLKTSDIQTRDDSAEAVGLVKRNRFCDVVNVVTTVDCWFLPKHKGNQNRVIRSFKGTTNNIEFACWTKCESVGGIK